MYSSNIRYKKITSCSKVSSVMAAGRVIFSSVIFSINLGYSSGYIPHFQFSRITSLSTTWSRSRDASEAVFLPYQDHILRLPFQLANLNLRTPKLPYLNGSFEHIPQCFVTVIMRFTFEINYLTREYCTWRTVQPASINPEVSLTIQLSGSSSAWS